MSREPKEVIMMFSVEFKCTAGGKPVSLDVFIDDLLTYVIQGIATDLKKKAPAPLQAVVQTIVPRRNGTARSKHPGSCSVARS
jgi:hypothetical protein